MGTSPTAATTLQRPDLGELAYEYMITPSTMGLMGLDILPVFGVDEKSADYPMIPTEAVLKIQEVARADRGNYPRSDWQFETKTYACQERGWEELVGDDEWRNYARFFDLQQESVARALFVISLAQEKDIATLLFNASTFSGATGSVTNEWDDPSNATPRADVNTAKQAALVDLDSMAVSYKVFLNLINIDEVKDALKYTNPIEMGGLEMQRTMVAKYLGLDNVFVSNAKYDSKPKATATTLADVWNDEYALVFKRAEGMSLRNPALGRTFLWERDSPEILTVEEYREEQTRSNVYRVRQNADEVVQFATGAGYLLANITS